MPSDSNTARNVAIACVVVALFYLGWQIIEVLLLVLTAMLLAVALGGIAEWQSRFTRLPPRYAVIPVALIVIGAVGGVLYMFGNTIRIKTEELIVSLPAAWTVFESRFHIQDMSIDSLIQRAEHTTPSTVISVVRGVTSNAIQGTLALFLTVVAALYFALEPQIYRRIFLAAWPPERRPEIERRMMMVRHDLLGFLKAQFIAMVIVGLLIYAGLTFVGLSAALPLALFAAMAEFVPLVGPIIASVPALLIALTLGIDSFLWTLLVFLVVQQCESNLLSPLLQQHAVSLPPAVTLFAVLGFGSLFGPLGMLLATPIMVVVFAVARARATPAPPEIPAPAPAASESGADLP